jgi:hypothetical protein
MTATPTLDPASKSRAVWVATLANLKSRGAPDTDPQVIACRQGLAYYRAQKAIDAEAGQLSRAGVDRLVAALRQDAAVSR